MGSFGPDAADLLLSSSGGCALPLPSTYTDQLPRVKGWGEPKCLPGSKHPSDITSKLCKYKILKYSGHRNISIHTLDISKN